MNNNEKNFVNKFLNKLKFTICDLLIINNNKLLTIKLHNTKIRDHMIITIIIIIIIIIIIMIIFVIVIIIYSVSGVHVGPYLLVQKYS